MPCEFSFVEDKYENTEHARLAQRPRIFNDNNSIEYLATGSCRLYVHASTSFRLISSGSLTRRFILRVALKRLEVLRQLGQPRAQEIPKHRHVHWEAAQIVGEVALRQNAFYQIYHDLHSRGFRAIHYLQNQGGQNVEALAIADGFVPAGEAEQNATKNRLVVPTSGAAEQAATCSVQILRIAMCLLLSTNRPTITRVYYESRSNARTRRRAFSVSALT